MKIVMFSIDEVERRVRLPFFIFNRTKIYVYETLKKTKQKKNLNLNTNYHFDFRYETSTTKDHHHSLQPTVSHTYMEVCCDLRTLDKWKTKEVVAGLKEVMSLRFIYCSLKLHQM